MRDDPTPTARRHPFGMTAEALTRFVEDSAFLVAFDDEGPPPEEPLLRAYGGPLRVRGEGPRLVANFVATADGVTAFSDGAGEGAMAVSLHHPADRLLMALLRCAADCVLIGAGTLRDDAHHQWIPSTPAPDLAEELAEHRLRLTGTEHPPLLAVVTGSGALPVAHPALTRPEADVLVITTAEGEARLPALHPRVRVAVVAPEGEIGAAVIVEAVRAHVDGGTVLCEGGPRLFGQILAAGLVDELFLTVAPQLAGRDARAPRPGLVSHTAFAPRRSPRLSLRSLRRSGDHLFVRYAVTIPG